MIQDNKFDWKKQLTEKFPKVLEHLTYQQRWQSQGNVVHQPHKNKCLIHPLEQFHPKPDVFGDCYTRMRVGRHIDKGAYSEFETFVHY